MTQVLQKLSLGVVAEFYAGEEFTRLVRAGSLELLYYFIAVGHNGATGEFLGKLLYI